MEISYRNLDPESLDDFQMMAKWHGDPAIRYLLLPQRDEYTLLHPETAEELQAERRQPSPFHPAADLFILSEGIPIGSAGLIYNPPHRMTTRGKVAWFWILVGEAKLRRHGIASQAIRHLESLAAAEGAGMAEVGIFEFNEPAQRFFRSLGYEEIGRVDNFTYWNGRRWADVRFSRRLKITY